VHFQNAHLAFALNQAKEENSCLNQHVSELKDEIIDLRVQLSDLRSKQDEDRSYAERMEEAEFQRRLAVSFIDGGSRFYIHPSTSLTTLDLTVLYKHIFLHPS
jgi:hypothetical protein